KGGMFDPVLTGGSKNFDRYNHIELSNKIVNPITKNAIKALLELNESDYNDIMEGKKLVDGSTGMEYFEKALGKISVDGELTSLTNYKKRAPKSKINLINRKLRYLNALKDNKLKPTDYLISKVPVVPTGFRPIMTLPTGTIEPASLNFMYRDIGLASKLANEKSFPNFLKNKARKVLYDQVSGMQGVTDPTINRQTTTRKIKSALTELGGAGSPKGGFLHSKLLSKTQDYIGSSVIAV